MFVMAYVAIPVLLAIILDFIFAIRFPQTPKRNRVVIILLAVFMDVLMEMIGGILLVLHTLVLGAVLTVPAMVIMSYGLYRKKKNYEEADSSKEQLYANHNVIVFVPHEDDEINLAGGIIEQYIKYGSVVRVVYITNGDAWGKGDKARLGEIRINEAINACSELGIPEEDVIFLGYGDGYKDDYPHIYNAPVGKQLESLSGRRVTYGTSTHPAFHNGNVYSSESYFDDIRCVILQYLPDVIFCNDYDYHPEHIATSMAVEKTLGELIKTRDYHPQVYKGFAYRYAYLAPADFFAENVLSTVNAEDRHYINAPFTFCWEERIRFPILASSISRDLKSSTLFKAFSMHKSQSAERNANSVINGDKVFWMRRTDSLCSRARIEVSSGDAHHLTDFMLLDCHDIKNNGKYPFDGVWIPDKTDLDRTVKIVFPIPTKLSHIVLYDNPSPDDNILNIQIEFNDGTKIQTGSLNHSGAGTRINVQKENVTFFTVRILQFEGEKAGLAEIEAFSNGDTYSESFIKLMDQNRDFAYDYTIPLDGKQCFGIYRYGLSRQVSENYLVECDNPKCSAKMKDDCVEVQCPQGQKCMVKVSVQGTDIFDRIVIRNEYQLVRKILSFWIMNEQRVNDMILTTIGRKIIRKATHHFRPNRGQFDGK